MTIQPEVIPSSSEEGTNALLLNNDWYIYILIAFGFIFICVILKFIIQSFLILLGLISLWRLASN